MNINAGKYKYFIRLFKDEIINASLLHLLNLNILNGHKDYTKFILLTRARSGSNLLISSLSSHTNVVAFGELFSKNHEILFDYPGFKHKTRSKRLIELRRTNVEKFLDSVVLRKYQKKVKSVGFKLFYSHALKHPVLLDIIKNDKSINIIHLIRENYFDSFVSDKIAAQTGIWFIKYPQTIPDIIPFHIDSAECLYYFKQVDGWVENFKQIFHSHNFYELTYESLAENYLVEMNNIQEFLGLPLQNTIPKTTKQNNKNYNELIINYQELKNNFSSTKYSTFFE